MKTFRMGGVHPHDDKISKNATIEIFPPLDKAYISMSQHIGAPAKPIVKVGDYVKVGQLIGEKAGFISANIHSSVSGTVTAIKPYADLAGKMVNTIFIDVEGDEWEEKIDRSPELAKEIRFNKEEIIKRIEECGIVGMGGASFPTNVKLSPPPGKIAEFLIINGVECEPYLTSDYRMMMEYPDEILVGASILMKALDVKKGFIAIEENKREAIELLKSKQEDYPGIKIVPLKKKYPQGGEKQLIDAVVGRQVPSKGLPIDAGAVVQNCATAFAVYEAVQKHKPLFEGVITITGLHAPAQKNYKLRVGTPLEKVAEYAGGIPDSVAKLISGGPMMGKAIFNMSAASVKSSSSILMFTKEETIRKEESNCIRCGKCIEACPMGLEPYMLYKLAKTKDYDQLEKDLVYDCIECGCCLYTCPANIPLLDLIRVAKSDVMGIIKSRPKK